MLRPAVAAISLSGSWAGQPFCGWESVLFLSLASDSRISPPTYWSQLIPKSIVSENFTDSVTAAGDVSRIRMRTRCSDMAGISVLASRVARPDVLPSTVFTSGNGWMAWHLVSSQTSICASEAMSTGLPS